MRKLYIWSLPSRVFHWLLALLILMAFITGDEDRLLTYHAIVGYLLLIVLVFRLVWGFLGPRFSLFYDFSLQKEKVRLFIKNFFSKNNDYVGHNPLASYVFIGMFILIFCIVITGILTFGAQEARGIASFLNQTFFKEMDVFKDIHEFFANMLILFIVLHLFGLFFDKLFHDQYKTWYSMFNGYKYTNLIVESIKLNWIQKILALIFIVGFIYFLIFSLSNPKNILLASSYSSVDYNKQNVEFVNECASCHILYPPELLPKDSWKSIMLSLTNHFGDDASIDKETEERILVYLLQNSAEFSRKEMSVKMLKYQNNKDIIAISETDFWKKTHKNIPKSVFLHEDIKTKTNCKACHSDIENGLIEDDKIKNIRLFG